MKSTFTARYGFGKMRNYTSRLEAKIIFDGKVNSRLFPILMRIIVSGAFRALHAVKLISKSSLYSVCDSFQRLFNVC